MPSGFPLVGYCAALLCCTVLGDGGTAGELARAAAARDAFRARSLDAKHTKRSARRAELAAGGAAAPWLAAKPVSDTRGPAAAYGGFGKGYCAKTTAGEGGASAGRNSCAGGTKGSWNLHTKEVRSWQTAFDACVKLCRLCKNCNWVSTSMLCARRTSNSIHTPYSQIYSHTPSESRTAAHTDSHRYRDCSWFKQCDMKRLRRDVQGFRTIRVDGAKVQRPRHHANSTVMGNTLGDAVREQRNEVNFRYGQLMDFAAFVDYNASGVSELAAHPAARSTLRNGIHLSSRGQRWSGSRLSQHANQVDGGHFSLMLAVLHGLTRVRSTSNTTDRRR